MKTCNRCFKSKPTGMFYKRAVLKGGHMLHCKECSESDQRLIRYRLDDKAYEALLQSQDYSCGVCTKPLSDVKKIAIDHCHETGDIRGILCSPCNVAIGMLGDNISGLQKAIKYLNLTET